MVEWPSSETERTLDQSAANGRKHLFLPNAAPGSKGIYVRYAHVCFFHVALYAPTILKGPQS